MAACLTLRLVSYALLLSKAENENLPIESLPLNQKKAGPNDPAFDVVP